jgi:hypothetical protein
MLELQKQNENMKSETLQESISNFGFRYSDFQKVQLFIPEFVFVRRVAGM